MSRVVDVKFRVFILKLFIKKMTTNKTYISLIRVFSV